MIGNSLSWLIGGAQGSGVDTSANVFARACSAGGLYVFGKREYYSNIKGEHSYFQVRVSDHLIRSHVDGVELLATFDDETAIRHTRSVVSNGGIIYDSTLLKTKVANVPTLEAPVVLALEDYLRSKGLEPTLEGLLQDAKNRGVHLYPLPYNELLGVIGREIHEESASILQRMINVMAVAASFALLEYDFETLAKAIRLTFRAKPKVVDMNIHASKKVYDYFTTQMYNKSFPSKLETVNTDEKRILVLGSQAVGLGKLLSGCRFQTYYPITPASDESEYLEGHEVFEMKSPAVSAQVMENPQVEEVAYLNGKGSVVVVQTEDEIAAITMATGASLSGVRAATSTSGPGFSLMAEGMGWAGMNEVPVVVTLYQRAGPSTGLPTRHEQGDLRFAMHAGHGEFPRIVLASGDIEECFYDTVRAFNYAERYQLPVIHIVDKSMANSNATVPIWDTRKVKIDRGLLLNDEEAQKIIASEGLFKRFKFAENGISARVKLGTKGAMFWNTGDEHDEYGHITEDPTNRMQMMEKRMRKLETADREIPLSEKVNFFGPEDADATILSWGSTKGAILDAIDVLKDEGYAINYLHVRLIHPLPTEYVAHVLSSAKRKIHVEMNYSAQFSGIVREKTGIAMDNFVVKYNGRPMSSEEIYYSVKKVLAHPEEKRVVLTHGA